MHLVQGSQMHSILVIGTHRLLVLLLEHTRDEFRLTAVFDKIIDLRTFLKQSQFEIFLIHRMNLLNCYLLTLYGENFDTLE